MESSIVACLACIGTLYTSGWSVQVGDDMPNIFLELLRRRGELDCIQRPALSRTACCLLRYIESYLHFSQYPST